MNYSNLTYEVSRWSLGDLFPAYDSEEMKAAFAAVESKVSDFESLRPKLNADIPAADFMAIVRKVEASNVWRWIMWLCSPLSLIGFSYINLRSE